MLAKVEQFAFDVWAQEQGAARGQFAARSSACAPLVDDCTAQETLNFPANLLHFSAVIHFFEIEEVAWIEQTDLIDRCSAYQVEAACYPVAVNRLGTGSLGDVVGFVSDQTRVHCEASQSIRKVAERGIALSVLVDEAQTEHAAAWLCLHVPQGQTQGVLRHIGIGVEQQHQRCIAQRQGLVVCSAKTDVDLVLDDLAVGKVAPEQGDRTILRCVVYDDDAYSKPGAGDSQVVNAPAQQSGCVVADQNHEDLGRLVQSGKCLAPCRVHLDTHLLGALVLPVCAVKCLIVEVSGPKKWQKIPSRSGLNQSAGLLKSSCRSVQVDADVGDWIRDWFLDGNKCRVNMRLQDSVR